ncbi:MAG: hypothetical protein IPM74_19705 [Crocinitomicaceae bacterium]|nr:hypothetical protein [Crocinitomicaceae bacterium]
MQFWLLVETQPLDHVKELAQKWFYSIPARVTIKEILHLFILSMEERELRVEREVPSSAIYGVQNGASHDKGTLLG